MTCTIIMIFNEISSFLCNVSCFFQSFLMHKDHLKNMANCALRSLPVFAYCVIVSWAISTHHLIKCLSPQPCPFSRHSIFTSYRPYTLPLSLSSHFRSLSLSSHTLLPYLPDPYHVLSYFVPFCLEPPLRCGTDNYSITSWLQNSLIYIYIYIYIYIRFSVFYTVR